ncbi:uncharacterized protein LOC124258003 [Haliotis rubra]|uniref:uncharacterized protein LOC124258003 n=1 Tax=Haliotis rubra TaxID=36100 RepID=UPI001EE60767|nr:uncharacterized protein LOC124258003 [Haliotis rubra]
MVYDVAAVVVSVIVLTGVVLIIVAGLCTSSWCCQHNTDTTAGEGRSSVANEYVNYNPRGNGKSEKKKKSWKNRFSRASTSCGNPDYDDAHIYEDVTTRRPSVKKEEPCRGYLSMEVLKITPSPANTCPRVAKSMYISDVNLQ